MADLATLSQDIIRRAAASSRFLVGIAGPPGSGKSTLSAGLADELKRRGEAAIVVPMDGFHFDDIILNARGHRARKGAPHTFDVAGLEILLKRIRAREPAIAIPVFDRSLELSRAAAAIVDEADRIILIEGNYLLLGAPPWNRLKSLFDVTIMLDVPEEELARRLTARIMGHGHDQAFASHWIASNDLPNARTVIQESLPADIVVAG